MTQQPLDPNKIPDVLDALRVSNTFGKYNPTVVGTIPLKIHLAESDLDIVCEVSNFDEFKRVLRDHFERHDGFRINERTLNDIRSVVCNFRWNHWPVEVVGQPIPIEDQYAYRHFQIEVWLLESLNESFREEIQTLKKRGRETEPAFADLLKLTGDPYESLLQLESMNTAT